MSTVAPRTIILTVLPHYSSVTWLLYTLLCLGSVVLSNYPSVSHAQMAVTPDGTLSTTVTSTPVGAGYQYDITGGTPKGTNLFHSFDTFSVPSLDTAKFSVDGSVQNILSRVTGGTQSQIDGTIRAEIAGSTDISSANLYFMNPAGIIFGENAHLEIGGALHATTADYIALEDGTHFNAVASPDAPLLTAANPAAFGFLTPNPAPIYVTSGTPGVSILSMPTGKTLSLVGGGTGPGEGIIMDGAFVLARGGRINLVSVASEGEAIFDGTGFNVDSFTQLGDVNVVGGSVIDGHEVYISGGQFTVDTSLVMPGFFFIVGVDPQPPNGGDVNAEITGDIIITGAGPSLFGFMPGIRTIAGSPNDIVPGDVPGINLSASNVSVSNASVIQIDRLGPGAPGDIHITADGVSVRDGASVSLVNYFDGPGGMLIIDAKSLELSEQVGDPHFTGLAAQSAFHPGYEFVYLPFLATANAGTIDITADSITVSGGAEISASSFNFGSSGDIIIHAGDMSLSGGAGTGVIATRSRFAGPAGSLQINATGQINLTDGFQISGTTTGSGDGGIVSVSAEGPITLSGTDGGIFSATVPPTDSDLDTFARLFRQAPCCTTVTDFASLLVALGLPNDADFFDALNSLNNMGLTSVADLTAGNAGKVSITTPSLTLNAGAVVDSSSAWDGDAGQVEGTVGTLAVNDDSHIRSRTGLFKPDSGELVVGSGDAGTVTFTADSISISGGDISTTTRGDGAGGDINLDSAGNIEITSGGSVTSESVGTGNAGNIAVTASDAITASGPGSVISTTTFDDGNAGNISLSASEINIQGGGSVTSESGGTLDGEFLVGMGNAGTVNITATGPNTITISGTDSRVSTTTNGAGAGGDINLDSAGNVKITDGGSVTSESTSTGDAGSIIVTASNAITASGSGSVISTTTFDDGNAGNISLSASEINIQGGGSVTSESGGTLDGEFLVGMGNAGTVTITATGPNTLTISGTGSTVSTTTNGAGAGGDIELVSARNVEISSGGSVTSESTSSGDDAGDAGGITISAGHKINLDRGTISTRTENSEGGDIEMTAPKWVYLLNSEITTSVKKGITAGGGDITIDPEFVILNHSNILANAFGGPGGNINIVADNVLISAQSSVDASSQLGIDGTVNISNPDQEVAQELAVLPENYLDISGLISDRCGAAAGASSLVPAGPGGLTVDPDGYLPSFGAPGGQGTDNPGNSSRWWGPALDPSALHLTQATCIR